MKKFLSFIIIVFLTLSVGLISDTPSSALSASDFNPGRIIDDSVFNNSSTMSVDQIQNFLNSKVPTCDRNHAGFTGASGTVYNPPWTCLKEYNENPTTKENNIGKFNANGSPYQVPGGQSAAQIIYSAAQAYSINPQVLLVLLEKEQSLVTDTWPVSFQYRAATGYGCPDTAACDSTYYGFYNQVTNAARQFRKYANYPDSFNFKGGVTRYIQYNPSASCGGSNVYIQNQATASLYNYTPYQPNSGALSGMSDSSPGSTVNCGAYGNRNFFWYFNRWFGSTFALPKYSWSINSFDYSGGDNLMEPGDSEIATLKVTNTGYQTWYNSGNNPVRLGTWEPANSSTSLSTRGWLSANRLANMQENSVSTGQTATFTFPIGVTGLGTYYQSLNLVAENDQWMNWPGFRPTLVGTSAYSWSLEGVSYSNGTGLMNPGTSQNITVSAKNTGTATWYKNSGPVIKLATWQPDRQSKVGQGWLSPTRVVALSTDSVAPGQTAQFQFSVNMPGSGPYYERLNLVAEGKKWFNDQNLTLYLEGKKYSWQPVWVSPSSGTYTVPKNTPLTLTIKVKNTGNATWTKYGSFPTRIGTALPQNRGSALETPSWINSTRPGGLIEDTVAPGQEGTFSFSIKTPNYAVNLYESFNLLAEGLMWFQDPKFAIQLKVY